MGFFRKVAGAFVELPDPVETPPGSPGAGAAPEESVEALLARIDAGKPHSGASPSRQAPVANGLRQSPGAPAPAAGKPAPAGDSLALTPEQVFLAAGIPEGANSANRLLKMLAGLAMFPPEQQLAMVRALDAADESWTEQGVLADARQRQQALRTHLDVVEREHTRRAAALTERGREGQAKADEVVADIDRQIAALQALRQEALTEAANNMAALDAERRELDVALEGARKRASSVASILSNMITFFAGHSPTGTRSAASHGG